MNQQEIAFRASSETQARFRDCGLDGWMDICAAEQEHIVSSLSGWPAGSPEHSVWLTFLREAHLIFPSEPEFRERIQVKFNRRCEGLPIRHFADTKLLSADGETTLLSQIVQDRNVVVVAGSIT